MVALSQHTRRAVEIAGTVHPATKPIALISCRISAYLSLLALIAVVHDSYFNYYAWKHEHEEESETLAGQADPFVDPA